MFISYNFKTKLALVTSECRVCIKTEKWEGIFNHLSKVLFKLMSMSTFNLILEVFCLCLLSNIFIFTVLQFHHTVPKLDLLFFFLTRTYQHLFST